MGKIKDNVVVPLLWFIGTPVVLGAAILLYVILSNRVVSEGHQPYLKYSLAVDEAQRAELTENLKLKSVGNSLKFAKNQLAISLIDEDTRDELYCFSMMTGKLDCWVETSATVNCATTPRHLQRVFLDVVNEKQLKFECSEDANPQKSA
ncbi:hypothetical protein [Undibacterium sp. TJN19]|uniref:hypothetical protein n=1 Tax=Undibacterium sp. TJN19 TaxID=3413055 RepID=UPI003BF1DA2F